MKRILERIAAHAHATPDQLALQDMDGEISYRELQQTLPRLASQLEAKRIGILMTNSCAWALVDLAIHQREALAVPVPPFFSNEQLSHLISDAELDLIVTDQPRRLESLLHIVPSGQLWVANRELSLFKLPIVALRALPPETAKITYTSGTTGHPKGVCLSASAIAEVTLGLSRAVDGTGTDRTLSLLPLATLLENIGGLYAPLVSGGTASLPDLAACGFSGSSEVEPQQLIAAFYLFTPTTTIVVPQLLKLMVEAIASGAPLPETLRFIAVGGAPCATSLIERARELGLPVYQGYGLSEAASVISLNRPDDENIDSVGRPLAHAGVRIAADGEIVVSGALFRGYLGGEMHTANEWPTGDLGYLDEGGYLHISGRKKTAYATAYGRNISPEWVESELTASRTLMQAAVFGEGRPCNVALLVPNASASMAQIDAAVAAANARLPDYARIKAWSLAASPFSPQNGLARASGSLNRIAIEEHYATELENLYPGEQQHVAL